MLSAAAFGAKGDGVADDSRALQAALDATFAPGGPKYLLIPPGRYRITRPLRVASRAGAEGNVVRHGGITAHGAQLTSEITDGSNVIEFVSHSTVRFLLFEGLDVQGNGREGNGIHLECEHNEHFLYNFCLRDTVVQGCGGDGCRLVGNVFEGQLFNSYFRNNKGNGVTFGHGFRKGILSAIHVYGCVFGENGRHGAALINNSYDVSFHGCYFLLSGKYGLAAANGCTLLTNCGFENNHQSASGFEAGDGGVMLQNFGTLVGCTAYSIYNQTSLISAFVVGELVLVGCVGHGDQRAKRAGLAKIGGQKGAGATIIGSSGRIEYLNNFEALELGGGGVRLGSRWDSSNLARLGQHHLWVDKEGRLRIKNGTPASDQDGAVVGGQA
ncbi:MAG TPA: glycosyl hydrolase family 28-related protein [Vineibacter sp.]|nr:glycosyl hydrolase family 28-related protein [Vineibacter sp.]